MSLGIGAWLYDASADYSKSSKEINNAMLKAFSMTKKEYTNTPDVVLQGVETFNPFSYSAGDRNNIKQNINDTIKRSNIPKDMLWILK
jgi:membrane-associated HD superfamily phosphohydrolase